MFRKIVISGLTAAGTIAGFFAVDKYLPCSREPMFPTLEEQAKQNEALQQQYKLDYHDGVPDECFERWEKMPGRRFVSNEGYRGERVTSMKGVPATPKLVRYFNTPMSPEERRLHGGARLYGDMVDLDFTRFVKRTHLPQDIKHVKLLKFGTDECKEHLPCSDTVRDNILNYSMNLGQTMFTCNVDLYTDFYNGGTCSWWSMTLPYRGHLHNFYLGHCAGYLDIDGGVYRWEVYRDIDQSPQHPDKDRTFDTYCWSCDEVDRFKEFLKHFDLATDTEEVKLLESRCWVKQ